MQTITQMSKKSIAAIIFSVLLVLSLFMSYLSTPLVGAEPSTDKVVLGYYASWAPPADDFDPNKITHLNYSFGDICMDGMHGNPNNEEIAQGAKTWDCTNLDGSTNTDLADGSIVMYEPELDLVELANVEKLKEQNPDLKTLLSIGGWTLSHNLSDVAADEEMRATLADSAVEFIRTFNMDGLDVDWEYPVRPDWGAGHPGNAEGENDADNFILLLKDIREALDVAEAEDGQEYLLTMAGGQQAWFINGLDLATASNYLDYLAVMAYDTNGTWDGRTGHNAPLYNTELEEEFWTWPNGSVDMAVNAMLNANVPAEQVVVGLAFYGQAWGGCNLEDEGAHQSENGPYQVCSPAWESPHTLDSTGYGHIQSIVNQDGYKYYWDNGAKVPYLYNEDKGEFVSYDNVESLQYKVNYINKKNLGGAMIWDLATDDADYNLLKTVSHGLGVSSDAPEDDPEQPGFNIEELNTLIEEAQAISNEDEAYTADSFASLQDAIAVAVAALETIETEEELEASLASLQSAIDGLEEDTTGPEGPAGEDGADGTDGTDGADGTDGTDGADGTDGTDGADGTDGTDGADGTDGTDTDNTGTDNTGNTSTDNTENTDTDTDTGGTVVENNGNSNGSGSTTTTGNNQGNKLPATATNMFNLLVAGFVVIALGTTMFFIQRRKKNITE